MGTPSQKVCDLSPQVAFAVRKCGFLGVSLLIFLVEILIFILIFFGEILIFLLIFWGKY